MVLVARARVAENIPVPGTGCRKTSDGLPWLYRSRFGQQVLACWFQRMVSSNLALRPVICRWPAILPVYTLSFRLIGLQARIVSVQRLYISVVSLAVGLLFWSLLAYSSSQAISVAVAVLLCFSCGLYSAARPIPKRRNLVEEASVAVATTLRSGQSRCLDL